MDANHQDKTGSKLRATEDKLWLPPLSPKDQKKLTSIHKKPFSERAGFSGKSLWDWLPLLIQLFGALAIPVAIAIGTAWFSYQQNQTSLQITERQHQTDIQIAQEQQQETALQNYLDHMSDLLLNSKLQESKPGDEIRNVARARTLTILRRLDQDRKELLIQFIYEDQLINVKNPIISLATADLRNTRLSFIDLPSADLSKTDLRHANLMFTNLHGASLRSADLHGTNLSAAILSAADLFNTNFRFADLSYADLSNANLGVADLSGADLSYTNLKGAIVTNEQLAQAKSLKGAIMPDGSIHP